MPEGGWHSKSVMPMATHRLRSDMSCSSLVIFPADGMDSIREFHVSCESQAVEGEESSTSTYSRVDSREEAEDRK